MREQKRPGGINNHVVFKVEQPNDNTGMKYSFSSFDQGKFSNSNL